MTLPKEREWNYTITDSNPQMKDSQNNKLTAIETDSVMKDVDEFFTHNAACFFFVCVALLTSLKRDHMARDPTSHSTSTL